MGKKHHQTASVESLEIADGDETARGNWSGKCDFFLSAVGYAVGLGNVWRFPYRAYSNGGASFLIPYIITLALAGLPLFFLEMALGQFSSQGPISVWKAVPFFKGIGWAMAVISFLTCIYYNMIIAYTLFYTFASFTSEVPWQHCRPEWAQYGCVEREMLNKTIRNQTETWCAEMREMNTTNVDGFIGNCTVRPKSPSQIYWEREVLDMSDGIDEGTYEMRWQLVLCLLLAWIVVFFCLIKGIKSSGKVVYFTATFPYIVLFILLCRNATLEGARLGIEFYIIPEWSKLASYEVWYSAAVQIFYSLGVAFGALGAMTSYNKFHNNCYRDAVVVAILNCGTSIFAGFVIFSVIGHMAYSTGVDIEDVADAGPGLAFVAYPEGIAMMPIAPLWAILFFCMLFTLGLDSQFGMMETVITSMTDEFPLLKRSIWHRCAFIGSLCMAMFLIGLPQCSRAGIYVMNLFDWYCAGFSLMVVSLLEVCVVAWIYGYKRFSLDIKMMIGHEPNWYWKVCWIAVTPILMATILVFAIVQYAPVYYGSYKYPAWADGLGWGMVAAALIFIPVLAVYEYCKSSGMLNEMKKLFKPTYDWGPLADKYRTGRYAPLGNHENETPPPEYDNAAIEMEDGVKYRYNAKNGDLATVSGVTTASDRL